jgi:multiple sugar transport system ATP-binding protein
MAMSDRIVVMSNAQVQQVGTPAEVYGNPANLFVARFIGSPGMNLISGRYAEGVITLPGDNRYPVPAAVRARLEAQVNQQSVTIGFRPEAARLTSAGALRAQVYAEDMHGSFSMLHLTLAGEQAETVVHIRTDRGLNHAIGEPLRFDLDPERVRFFDPQTEKAI